MSNKLEEARKIINEVDSQMAELFVKRMRAAEMVYEYKKEFGLPILDQKREDAVIEKNSALVEDEVLKGYRDYRTSKVYANRKSCFRVQRKRKHTSFLYTACFVFG